MSPSFQRTLRELRPTVFVALSLVVVAELVWATRRLEQSRRVATPSVCSRLVDEAFAHPAVRARRPILVTLPRGDSAVLQEVEAHVDGALSRVAGVTCLVEGRVRAAR